MHSPLPATALAAASPLHLRSQVDPESQLSEQLSVQVTWQVAFEPQEMLPLLPSVTVQTEASQLMLPLSPAESVQVLPLRQLALHDLVQVPVQVLASTQLSEQLSVQAAAAES